MTLKAIATIKHNDIENERVTLYAHPDGSIWAAGDGETAYPTMVPACEMIRAWAGVWDLRNLGGSPFEHADWEDGDMYCAHCSGEIESAYGDDAQDPSN